MNIIQKTKFPITPESCRKETGKTLQEWFELVDAKCGPNPGRKAVGDFLFKEMKVDAWWATTLAVEYEAARGVVEKDGRPRGYNICATKSIAAAPEKVFARIQDTSWAGQGTQVDFVKTNPGKMARFTLAGAGHPTGELVEVKLTPAGGKCSIVVSHERIQDRGRADGLREAWGEILNQWKAELEA